MQFVSPSLIAGYELKNLEGRTLCSIYKEYIDASAKRKKISAGFITFLSYGTIIILVTVCLYLYHLTRSEFVIVFGIIGFAINGYFTINYPMNKAWEYNRIIAKCEEVFNKFEQSVKGLDPYFVMTNRIYTAEYTHEFLVDLAVRLLDAEKKFKEKRLKENELIWIILDAGNREVKRREEFEKLLWEAEKFGLIFNKTELFAFARARNILDETMMS